MTKLTVKEYRAWDGRGTAGGARVHNQVRIDTEGRGSVTVREWGPNVVDIWITGGDFQICPTAGNMFVITWPTKPERILLPAMIEEPE